MIWPLTDIPDTVFYSLPGYRDQPSQQVPHKLTLEKIPVSYQNYRQKIDQVMSEIHQGNSFLVNLTQPSKIRCNQSLKELYYRSQAKYKLLIDNHFVVFSPETFIRITDQTIRTFPMKGTIDAAIPEAESKILSDPKEAAEHYTIVDLMRSDLSRVASQVHVKKFRFIDRIATHEKEILQVSSEIAGTLPENYRQHLGNLLFELLPAGSITGAPKPKTVEIIEKTEGYNRGYYTGIFGIFDGKNLDSAVMIRFIEKTPEGLIFKSGGGITHQSQPESEYQELIDKVYVPLAGNDTNN